MIFVQKSYKYVSFPFLLFPFARIKVAQRTAKYIVGRSICPTIWDILYLHRTNYSPLVSPLNYALKSICFLSSKWLLWLLCVFAERPARTNVRQRSPMRSLDRPFCPTVLVLGFIKKQLKWLVRGSAVEKHGTAWNIKKRVRWRFRGVRWQCEMPSSRAGETIQQRRPERLHH